MAITNKNKEEKNKVLEEIEQDDTPIDDKGKPIVVPDLPELEDLLTKDPSELTAADMDFLSEHKDDLTDEQKVNVGLADGETVEEEVVEEEVIEEKKPVKPTPKVETEETEAQKEQRYKAQQTEAQIQAEKNRALSGKVLEAAEIAAPTEQELRDFVKQDGADWDELTTFEQAMARRTLTSEKKFNIVHESVKSAEQVNEWAGKVDDFIDMTDGKPEFIKLSSHEADFRKYAMKESHRGVDIQTLLNSFLYTLPDAPKTRGSLFNRGGGGEKVERKDGISDADTASQLRQNNPREYARQVKAGKIKIEI